MLTKRCRLMIKTEYTERKISPGPFRANYFDGVLHLGGMKINSKLISGTILSLKRQLFNRFLRANFIKLLNRNKSNLLIISSNVRTKKDL